MTRQIHTELEIDRVRAHISIATADFIVAMTD